MNILILNWRDIKNPKSGGAEVLTHEIAKSWVKMGNNVAIFSSYFPSAKSLETVDGVKIIRKGHPDTRFFFSSVHFLAFLYYRKNYRNFDVVVDEIHGIPFFTPWYVKGKKVVLICEVASDLWVKMFGSFFGTIGRLVEHFYLKFIYKDIPYLTISNSTKQELIDEGVTPQNITVLPMGITLPKRIKKTKKEVDLTLIYVGRLAKSKGIEDAIKALDKISKTYNNARLWIVGSGEREYKNFLQKMSKKLNLEKRIIFFDFVSQEKKFELMAKAHILVAPSLKEGWGLIVAEAAYVGTPSIVYNSPGLRDVLYGSKFKTIVKENSPRALADEVFNLFQNYDKIQKEKLNAKDLSWDKTATAALKILK